MQTFAEKALDGIEVRWTSNPVERAMGEVAKRCKRDWMQWSRDGLNAVLQLRLVKYQDQITTTSSSMRYCVNHSTRRFTALHQLRLLEVKSKRF